MGGVTSQSDWLSYNGETTGSRYSPLTQINKGNAGKMAPKWIFSLPNTSRLQVTPVVAGGVMYVTAEAGKGFMGGSFRQAPDEPAQRILRAIDIHTGKAVWGLPQTGAVNSWGGVLSTSGGGTTWHRCAALRLDPLSLRPAYEELTGIRSGDIIGAISPRSSGQCEHRAEPELQLRAGARSANRDSAGPRRAAGRSVSFLNPKGEGEPLHPCA